MSNAEKRGCGKLLIEIKVDIRALAIDPFLHSTRIHVSIYMAVTQMP
jgi:hypothetical protein